MPELYLAALDSEGQIVRTLNSGQAQLSLVEILEPAETASEITHFFSVRSNSQWELGTFQLKNITLVGEPARDYSLTVDTSQVLDSTKPASLEAA